MAGYLDRNVEPDPDALDKPDRTTGHCLAQFTLAVLFVIFVFAVVAMIGFYFYLRHLP
jgi:hypothetical protein